MWQVADTRWRNCSISGAWQISRNFGLADQEALQQGLVAELELLSMPQLFHRARRQVLRLVDDQQAALALARLADEKASSVISSSLLARP